MVMSGEDNWPLQLHELGFSLPYGDNDKGKILGVNGTHCVWNDESFCYVATTGEFGKTKHIRLIDWTTNDYPIYDATISKGLEVSKSPLRHDRQNSETHIS